MTTDRYGREITDNGNGTYMTDGINIAASDITQALEVFNAMAPGDWVEPNGAEPLDPVGALAALLVVVGTLDVQDAANAVGLTPNDLIAEVQAWEIASQQFGVL